jgi:formamidopyrimidine-DNA glycosylase
MPELPEVETMRRGLMPCVGGVIERIELPKIPYRPIRIDPPFIELRKRAEGTKVIAIDRIAKRVVVRLSSDDAIVMQPKMAGIAMLAPAPTENHIRFVAHLSGATVSEFLYWDKRGLGTVSLWNSTQMDQFLGPEVLGPDASIVDRSVFRARFQELNRPVKVAMLDQKIVSGIGNLYAVEILHAAKVHPEVRCHELNPKQWNRIHTETIRILNEAIEKEGSTLSDGTYRSAINGEGSYQNQHLVYDRADEKCKTCQRAKIVRIVQSQRSTFYCPKCQRV